MSNLIGFFLRDDSGATAIEYALLASLVAMAIIATLLLLGPQLDGTYQQILNALP